MKQAEHVQLIVSALEELRRTQARLTHMLASDDLTMGDVEILRAVRERPSVPHYIFLPPIDDKDVCPRCGRPW